jgi:hypothetical protein
MCLHLINTNSFLLADILLEYGCTQDIYSNKYFKNYFIINSALSKYLQNKKDEAKQILVKKDLSASNDALKIAYAVLTDDFERAYEIMIEIGDSGEVDKSDYKQWPLFNIIRKEDKFKETYRTIFKEDYTVMETPMSPIQELNR